MADHFLSKIRVANQDFVESGGRSVLEQFDQLHTLLIERAGPEAAALFAEPLISRGNDQATPTVSWYGSEAGDVRRLDELSSGDREQVERYLADHLRPVRALADLPETAGLALGALTVFGQNDVLVANGKPVIVNWGLMPGGNGANAADRPQHYAATLGKYLPLSQNSEVGSEAVTTARAAPSVSSAEASVVSTPPRREISRIAWVPLLVLLFMAAATLAWLLMPGTRLFHDAGEPQVTEADLLNAAKAENKALLARKAELESALAGAVCRADGQLILPGGLTPEGLTPPPLGTAPSDRAQAVPNAVLPSQAARVAVPDGDDQNKTLLKVIEQSTVMVLASSDGKVATGSGLVIGQGLIVTNYHVIENALSENGQILITGAALPKPQMAQVLKTKGPLFDAGADFALLQIDDKSLPAFNIFASDESLKLTNVVAAGYPGDVLETDAGFAALRAGDLSAVPDLTVTDGIINTEQKLGGITQVLMHSAALSRGNSGGPLVDMCGRLIGVNSFVRKGVMQNRGFALSMADLTAFLAGTPASPNIVTEACAPVIVRPDLANAPSKTEPKD